MPDDDVIKTISEVQVVMIILGDKPKLHLYFSASDGRVMIFPLSELPKIQKRLAEIAAEVKGED